MGYTVGLPNLELIEYKVTEGLKNNEIFIERFNKCREKNKYIYCDLDFNMFSQWWGNTTGGFEGIGGCAMTKEYTVVVYERNTDIYIVCFGDKPCYVVVDANDTFMEDLKNHSIAGLKTSKERY